MKTGTGNYRGKRRQKKVYSRARSTQEQQQYNQITSQDFENQNRLAMMKPNSKKQQLETKATADTTKLQSNIHAETVVNANRSSNLADPTTTHNANKMLKPHTRF